VLRSWIERARRRFVPAASVGLVIGRDNVTLAQLTAADGGWRVEALTETKLDTRLFSGTPTPQAAAALTKALQSLNGQLSDRYLPVHVSVPDAAMRLTTFELDELPKTRAAQIDLVRFRFQRESANGTDVITCQSLGKDGEKQLLLGLALEREWQRLIEDALAGAGVVAWSLNSNACRQFNRFHDRLVQASGALVTLMPDAWSLWLWDSRGRVRYTRSRWRAAADDHTDIAKDVERSILAYIHGHPERTITRMYLVAGSEAESMATLLDARSREHCVRLFEDDAITFGATVERQKISAASTIAAALEQ